MEKLTDDLNIISSLPENPALTSSEFRAKFDEAGKIIKNYINNIVEPAVTNAENNISNKADMAQLNEISNNLSTSMEQFKNEVNTELETQGNSLGELVEKATQYGDVSITETPTYTINHGHGGVKTHTATITKAGYFPLCIAGFVSEGVNEYHNSISPALLDLYLTETKIGSCKVNARLEVSNNSNWNYHSMYKARILWVKVKAE